MTINCELPLRYRRLIDNGQLTYQQLFVELQNEQDKINQAIVTEHGEDAVHAVQGLTTAQQPTESREDSLLGRLTAETPQEPEVETPDADVVPEDQNFSFDNMMKSLDDTHPEKAAEIRQKLEENERKVAAGEEGAKKGIETQKSNAGRWFFQEPKKGMRAQADARPELRSTVELLDVYLNDPNSNIEKRRKLAEEFSLRAALGEDAGVLANDVRTEVLNTYEKSRPPSEVLFALDKLDSSWFIDHKDMGFGSFKAREVEVQRLSDVVSTRKSKPTSLLSALPNAIDYLREIPFRNKLLSSVDRDSRTEFGLNQFIEFRDRVAESANRLLGIPPRGHDPKEKQSSAYVKDDLHQGPLQYLRDKNGAESSHLPSNVVTAVAAEFQNWVVTRGKDTAWNDDKNIAAIFNVDEEAIENSSLVSMKRRMRPMGTLRKNLVDSLGSHIYKQLNLGMIDRSDPTFEERMKTSLGLLAVQVGTDLGYLEAQSIPTTEFHGYKVALAKEQQRSTKNLTSEPESVGAVVPFIRVKSVRPEEGTSDVPSETVEELADDGMDVKPLLDELFDLSTYDRPFHLEPQTKVRRNIQGSINLVPKTVAGFLKTLQSYGQVPNQGAKKEIQKWDGDTFKTLVMGRQDVESGHTRDEDSQAGKNREIDTSFAKLKERYAGGDQPHFFSYFVKKNGRSFLDSSHENVQGIKLHRWTMINQDWAEDISAEAVAAGTDNEKIREFSLAVGLGMGVGVDKMSEKSALEAVEAKMEEEVVAAAVRRIQERRDAERYTKKDMEIIGAGVAAGGEKAHSLLALESWARYATARENRTGFKNELSNEVDGLSNGIALGLLQLSTSFGEHTKKMLNRVGIFFKDDPQGNSSYGEAKENNSTTFQDNYQDLSIQMTNGVTEIAEGNPIIDENDDIDPKYQRKAALEIQQLLPTTVYAKQIEKALKEESDTLDAEATKEGRNIAKKPLMTAIYGSGEKAVRRLISLQPVNYFYDQLVAIAKDPTTNDASKKTEIGTLITNAFEAGDGFEAKLNEDISSFTESKDVWEFARNYYLPKDVEKTIAYKANITYGKSAWQGLNNMLGGMMEVRQTIGNSVQWMNNVYVEVFNSHLDNFVETHGREPTKQEELGLKEQIRDMGLLPGFRTPGSDTSKVDQYQEYLEITSDTLQDVKGDENRARSQTTEGELAQQVQRRRPDKQVGVKGSVYLVHSLDNYVITKVGHENNIFHVFDAHVTGTSNVPATTESSNRIFLETNQDYGIMDEVQRRTVEFADRLADFQNNEDVALDSKAIEPLREEYGEVLHGKTLKSGSQTLGLNQAQELVAETRERTFASIQHVNQFNKHGNHHAVAVPQRVVQARPGSISFGSEIIGSSSATFDTTGMRLKYDKPFSRENAYQIMEAVEDLENQKIDPEHNTQLDKIMDRVIYPAMGQIDKTQIRLYSDPDGTFNEGKYKNRPGEIYLAAAENALTSSMALSMKETAVHEYTHAVLFNYLESKEGYWARNELRKLYDQAKEVVTPADFLPPSSDGRNTTSEREKAQERYDHVFNNPKGHELHEFAALGLTNQPFVAALSNIIAGKKKSEPSETPTNIWDSNPLKMLWNVFVKALEWINGRAYKIKPGQSVQTNLQNLAENIVAINNQQRDNVIHKTEDWVNNQAKRLDEKLEHVSRRAAKAVYDKWAGAVAGYKPEPNTVQGVKEWWEGVGPDASGYDPGNIVQFYAGHAKKFLEQDLKIGLTGFGANLWQEIRGLTKEDMKNWRMLKMKVGEALDSTRKNVISVTTKQAKEAFDPDNKMSKEVWQAVSDVVLRGDLSALTDRFNLRQIIELMSEPTALATQISAYRTKLQESYGRNGVAYANQAASLGMLMSTGRVPDSIENPMTNAYNIANLLFLGHYDREPVGDLKEAEKAIDELASLYAIQHGDRTQAQRALEIFQHEAARGEINGVNSLLGLHKAYKEISEEKLFDGNRISMWKGHTHENLDSNIRVRTGPPTPEHRRQMEMEGFVMVEPKLPKDPYDSNQVPTALYVSKVGLDRYHSSIASLTSEEHRGTNMLESFENAGMEDAYRSAQTTVRFTRNRMYRKAVRQFQEDLDVTTADRARLVPIVSPYDGAIVEYRYLMTTENKNNILRRDDQAHETIGRMMGSITDKVNTKNFNRQVVARLKAEHTALQGQTKFIRLAPDSPNEKSKEGWRLLPKDMQAAAEESNKAKELYVRPDLYNYIMGYREKSVTGTLLKYAKKGNIKVPVFAWNGISMADDAWREVIGYVRTRRSILLPEVVVDNAISNALVLSAHGVPPSYVISKTREGIHAMRKYQKARERKIEVNNLVAVATVNGKQPSKQLIAEQASLDRQMKANLVHELVEAGMFNVIVEDVDVDALKGANRKPIAQVLEKGSEKYLKGKAEKHEKVLQVGRNVLMTPGSQTFAAAVAANQYADFIGRYIQFKYDTEVRKKDRVEAIKGAMDNFIYYDEPSDPWIQAGNDYGFLMFSKFFLRIQRVYLKLLGERPATTLGVTALGEMAGIDHIGTYFASPDKLMNRFHTLPPMTAIETAEEHSMPLWEWLTLPYNFVFGD